MYKLNLLHICDQDDVSSVLIEKKLPKSNLNQNLKPVQQCET